MELRHVKGYKWHYMVSSDGNVYSFKNRVSCGHEPPTILKKISYNLTNHGYKRVLLCKNLVKRRYFIHRLVAIAFIPNPYKKPMVNHKDGNPSNNHLDNLEWCTQSENLIHAFRVLGKGKKSKPKENIPKRPRILRYGIDHHRSRSVVRFDNHGSYVEYASVTDAARHNKTSLSVIVRAIQNKRKTQGLYSWAYVHSRHYGNKLIRSKYLLSKLPKEIL